MLAFPARGLPAAVIVWAAVRADPSTCCWAAPASPIPAEGISPAQDTAAPRSVAPSCVKALAWFEDSTRSRIQDGDVSSPAAAGHAHVLATT